MLLLKPYPINHEGLPIYSVDIDPSGRRFATAGQCKAGFGLLKIWNTQSTLELKKDGRTVGPLLLGRIEAHTTCINCVRWSEKSNVLATAGTDCLVMIWTHVSTSSWSGSSSGSPPEYWKCTATLSGHAADVLGLDWSPGGSWLASCSVDNNIIIWNAEKFPEKVATLTGHESFVKGVSFDPIGKFLASQAADKSVKIWATSDWSLIKTIRKPFEEADDSTLLLRLDWSPDGRLLTSAHAMNNSGPVAKLIERLEWTSDRDFVGHRKAVTCVRWSNALYEVSTKGKRLMTSICAIGSKDRGISVWSMAKPRPLLVLKNLFARGIMDLAWDQRGQILLASSFDGNIACCKFTPDETGRALGAAEKMEVLRRLYGNMKLCVAEPEIGKHGSPAVIIENAEFLIAKNAAAPQAVLGVPPSVDGESVKAMEKQPAEAKLVPSTVSQAWVPKEQVEMRTKSGKRRIIPTPLDPVVDVISVTNEAPPTELVSQAEPGPRDQVAAAPPTTPKPDLATEKATADPNMARKTSVITSVGKEPSPVIVPKPTAEQRAIAVSVQPKRKGPLEKETPKKKRHKPESLKKRQRYVVSSDEEDSRSVEARSASDVLPKVVRKLVDALPALKKCKTLVCRLTKDDGQCANYVLTVENDVAAGRNLHLSQLSCASNSRLLWKVVLRAAAVCVRASEFITVVIYEDQIVGVYRTASGVLLSPMFCLDAKANYANCQGWHLLTISVSGQLNLWSFEDGAKVLCQTSVLPLLRGAGWTVASTCLDDHAAPILTLSNGDSFIFDFPMAVWLLVAEPSSAFCTLPSVRSLIGSHAQPKLDGPLQNLTKDISMNTMLPSCHPETLSALTENFIEFQLQACTALHSKDEYKLWMTQYVKQLVANDRVSKIRTLFDSLIRDMNNDRVTDSPKSDLLRTLLPLLTSNVNMQRLYGEYSCWLREGPSEDDFVREVADSICQLNF